MITGTERSVLELLFDRGGHSPTEVADALNVSVQTASRNLRQLADRGLVRAASDSDDHRGYKVYEPVSFASVFAGIEGALIERTFVPSAEKRAILSVWQVPQEEFHPALASYLFGGIASESQPALDHDVTALAVYGSVARGEAKPDSDVDVLAIAEGIDGSETPFNRSFIQDGGPLGFGSNRVISETWYREDQLIDGLEAGSDFLANALQEAIPLYDPDGVLRNARQNETGERIPRPG